jgi:sugar transferase (PEP-CTERM/EpsH1 system associated)
MARILFLSHRLPVPPNKGEKIRAFHILRHLARKHDVFLGALADEAVSDAWAGWLSAHVRERCVARLNPAHMRLNALAALVGGEPLSVRAFRSRALLRWCEEMLRTRPFDFVYVFSSAMAQYVPSPLPAKTRLIVDFVDMDAEKWRQYAAVRRGPARWLYAREARCLLRFDKAVAGRADAALFVTDAERRLFAAHVPECASRAHVVSNGIDCDHYRPAPPSAAAPPGRPTVLFVGAMSYPPNVDAALWFAREILPSVRRQVRDVRFRIVGARPAAAIRALGREPGIEVTGAVDDVRPYYRDASAVVAPLRIGRGIQNKVLEGMAMARPVIATPAALDGIAAENGKHVLIGRTAEEIAAAVADVLRGRAPPALGANARARVIERHDWQSHLAKLDALIAGEGRALGERAAHEAR